MSLLLTQLSELSTIQRRLSAFDDFDHRRTRNVEKAGLLIQLTRELVWETCHPEGAPMYSGVRVKSLIEFHPYEGCDDQSVKAWYGVQWFDAFGTNSNEISINN
jgi:hypothetical protein